MPGQMKIDDGAGNYTVLTNGGSLGSDKTITIPNTTGTMALTSDSFGKVLQVVQATTSTATEVASSTYADSGLTADITPSATGSKVLVIVNQNLEVSISDNGNQGLVKILRDTTAIVTDSRLQILTGGASSNLIQQNLSIIFLDSPSTTSSTTYKTQIKVTDTGSSGKIKAQDSSSPSTITLIEVGA